MNNIEDTWISTAQGTAIISELLSRHNMTMVMLMLALIFFNLYLWYRFNTYSKDYFDKIKKESLNEFAEHMSTITTSTKLIVEKTLNSIDTDIEKGLRERTEELQDKIKIIGEAYQPYFDGIITHWEVINEKLDQYSDFLSKEERLTKLIIDARTERIKLGEENDRLHEEIRQRDAIINRKNKRIESLKEELNI